MQVKHISDNMVYQFLTLLMMAVAKTGFAGTFSITQSGTRYISKFPGQLTSMGACKDQAAALYCVESQ